MHSRAHVDFLNVRLKFFSLELTNGQNSDKIDWTCFRAPLRGGDRLCVKWDFRKVARWE